VVGLFIYWRGSGNWFTLWVALIVVLQGTNSISVVVPVLTTVWPCGLLVSAAAGLLGMISNVHILFLAPDGRPVPRWSMRLAAGFTGALLALGAFTGWVMGQSGTLAGFSFAATTFFPLWLGMLALGLSGQIYRYRHVSSPVQRQQTKWMVVGLAAVALGFAVNAALLYLASLQAGQARVLTLLARAPLAYGCMLLLPVCLAFSILRYRLWDIDLLIRRTLVYASLTAALVLVYLASVVLLQRLASTLAGANQPQLVTVLSTLAIAALFVPLRQRLQNGIDRRFFRRKYDAARTLARFAASARDETDLDRLSAQLVGVVEQTMQPETASLWLRPTAGDDGTQRR
jgi:hypothetical protein